MSAPTPATPATPNKGMQSIFSADGTRLFAGQWDPRRLLAILNTGLPADFWRGKKVLDIGANTCGLSVELARAGANVVALEPDPYGQLSTMREPALRQLEHEHLGLAVHKAGLLDCTKFGSFDVVLCLGLIYHFRYPQYIVDLLSTIDHQTLFISTQSHPAQDLALFNRRGLLPAGYLKDDVILTGWHPTIPLFERMLKWAGFTDVEMLSGKDVTLNTKPRDVTNSTYFRAKRTRTVDPEVVKLEYYPR